MAEPGTQYIVSVKLTADDKEVRDAIAHLTGQAAKTSVKTQADSVKSIREASTQIGQAMSGFRHQLRAFSTAYQTVRNVVGFGVKDAIMGAVGINQDLENIELGMSAVLSSVDRVASGPYAKLTDAQKEITRLMGVMREEAAKTPAEFEGIASAFQLMLPSTRGLVNNLDDVVRLAANASTWDILAGTATGTTARDFKQILTGHMSMREIQNPMLASQLAQLKAVYAESMDLEKGGDIGGKVAKQKEMLKLMIELTKLTPEIQAMMAGGFTGQKEALVNQLKVLVQEGTKPIWEELKGLLRKLNDWVRTPEGAAKIRDFARDAAAFLKGAAVFFYDVVKFFGEHIAVLKGAFIAFMVIWGSVNVLRFVGALYAFAAAVSAGSFKDLALALLGLKGAKTVATGAALAEGVAGAAVVETVAARSAIASAAILAARVVGGAVAAAVLLEPEGYSDFTDFQGKDVGRRANALGMNPWEFGGDALSGKTYLNETTTFEFMRDFVAAAEKIKSVAETYSNKRVIPFNTIGLGPEAYPGAPRETQVIKNQITIDLTTGQATVSMTKNDPNTSIVVNTGGKQVGKGKDP